ncbi:MAG: tetratricopeptide repeat protein, partial [Acidimicrobiaceae bacterium]|nr:tetratricopeptide repeat protein [Acidimicrobiaceae bacterium]
MKFSQIWCMIVVLLLDLAAMVSFLSAQTEDSSAVNAPSSAGVQSASVEAQSSSDEPEQKKAALAPSRDTAPATDIETARLYNEFRSKFLDGRARRVDWWLEATAIFLTLIGVAAAILGYFGFRRLDGIESQARKNMEESEKHAKEAQRYQEEAQRDLEKIKDEAQRNLEEIKARRGEADSLVEGMNAKVAGSDPDKASEVVENVQQNPDSSLIERAVAAALSLQQQNRIEEAIEKWRSIANITEGIDDERAALAWFSIGYLVPSKDVDDDDFEREIEAYDKAIQLAPNLVEAYYNRGIVKRDLGQYEAAIADFDAAIAR